MRFIYSQVLFIKTQVKNLLLPKLSALTLVVAGLFFLIAIRIFPNEGLKYGQSDFWGYRINFPEDSTIVPEKNLPQKILSDSASEVQRIITDSIKSNKDLPDSILNSEKNFPKDSLSAADTTKIDPMAIDSSARIEHFRHKRTDSYLPKISERKTSSLFLKPNQNVIQKTVTIDSTGNFVEIRQKVGNYETKVPLKMPIEQYVQMKLREEERRLWEEQGYAYELKSDKKDLSQLLSEITNIEIPLPQNAILSIFGEPKISLRINGAVDIYAAWRSEKTEGFTASLLGNTKNEPDFKQTVQINVSGKIGDKLEISADWNTERTFEYENQLKIKYTGYEDEIIKSIEAGNVSMQTSPLIGGSEALFGVKAEFQVGPLSLTALASQKKAEVKEKTVSGGSSTQPFEIEMIDYSENHYFVDSVYTVTDENLNLFNRYFGYAEFIRPVGYENYEIDKIEVWRSSKNQIDQTKEYTANAVLRLPQLKEVGNYNSYRGELKADSGLTARRKFAKLAEGTDYIVHRETGFITFLASIQNEDVLAVAYNTVSGDQYGEFEANFGDDSIKVFKLIKPNNLQPSYKAAWKLQLKNIYSLPGKDIEKEGFSIDLKYLKSGELPSNILDNQNLLQVFGLDKRDENGGDNPDQKFDFLEGRTIWTKSGDIIFPVLEPFGKDFPENFGENTSKYNFPEIYTQLKSETRKDIEKNKFILEGEFTGKANDTYQIGFNVVENSVKVKLNGRELSPGSDYIVDYNIGQVKIRNAEALAPGASLSISYEENDLFSLASKTLVGLRALYTFNKETQLGFSLLSLNQETLSDKVRIGEEPISNTIMGADFKTLINMPFLTKGLDNIISTNAPSSLSLSGEIAYMNPDPNTKKSEVASDKDASIAYIDDFEGAKRTIPLGVNYSGWKDISIPAQLYGNSENQTNFEMMRRKAKSYWYNILPARVPIRDIWGDRRQAGRDDQMITVLDFMFDPNKRGTYNFYPDLAQKDSNWGGMMRPLSSTAANLVDEKIEFIEFWMKNESGTENAEVYIDLGMISEDVIANRNLDTEDKNKNDRLEESEDTGIDGMTDEQESAYYTKILSDLGIKNFVLDADPSNDNFIPLSNENYEFINGTQGNAQDISGGGRIPDTEDLNRNTTTDLSDNFFRYKVNLATVNNPYISGEGGGYGWYQYRIPLKDAIDSIGSPSLTNVETLRLWVKGASQEVHLRFVEFNLTGTQWEKLITNTTTKDDTVLTVSTISIEESQEYYLPLGIKREKDKTQTEEEVLKNEQSLLLKIRELKDGENREAFKKLPRPLDVFNYKKMKLFIHGQDTISAQFDKDRIISRYRSANNYNSEVYFRFGTDSSNFYEYRMPLHAGWQEIEIDFEKITALKQDRLNVTKTTYLPVEGTLNHFYGVKGNPTLTRIEYFTFGVYNPRNIGTSDPVSGDIWVNELRVIGADDTKGYAYTGTASLKLADLMDVSFNYSAQDPYFHKLADRFGTRNDSKSWNANVSFNATKLLPTSMKESNVRISYSRSENISKPLYIPASDINTKKAAEIRKQNMIEDGSTEEDAEAAAEKLIKDSETKNTSYTWSVTNLKLVFPSKAWYVENTINNLTFGFNYNNSRGRNPTTVYSKKWTWNASIKYDLQFGRANFFKPADIPLIGEFFKLFNDYKNYKVYFTPQTFKAGISANRTQSNALLRSQGSKPSPFRDFKANRDAGFTWKFTEGGLLNLSSNYNVTVSSTYNHLLTYNIGEEAFDRSESAIWRDLFKSGFFGKDLNYSQTVDLRTSPKMPSLWGFDKYFTVGLGYNVNYSWQNSIASKNLGRSAGYRNTYTLNMSLKLKSLTAPLFASDDDKSGSSKAKPKSAPRRPGTNPAETLADTSNTEELLLENKPSSLSAALGFLKSSIRWLLFDYENIGIDFSQTNSLTASGLLSEKTGFGNFWGPYNSGGGPSRSFMFGFSNNVGPRAPNGNLTNNFVQTNRINLKTSRPLWEGASLNIDWKVNWGINKTVNISTDKDGVESIGHTVISGDLERSFFSMPPSLMLSVFKSGIKTVNEKYDRDNSNNRQENLSNAFVDGFESLPLLSKLPFLRDVAKYVPRPNFSFSWNGLEKYSIFKGFAKRVSINSSYNSSYSERYRVSANGVKEISDQRISYGFNPLIGLNLTFKELFGGDLTGNFRYITKNNFVLGQANEKINENYNRDINVSLNFSKSGFEIPFFGISLKNDLTVSVSYTRGQNTTFVYDMKDFQEDPEPLEGTVRTTIEPTIKYVMSSRVTLSIFYRRSSVTPEGASSTPGTVTNEAGLEVHISIQ